MNNKKTILARVIAGALLLCLLCGCGQNDAKSEGNADAMPDVTASAAPSPTAAPSETPAPTAKPSESETIEPTETERVPVETKPAGTATPTATQDTRGEAMIGTWRDSVSGRAMMTVKRTEKGFSVVIHWANSAMDAVEWRMTGTFEDTENGRIVSSDCAMYEVSTGADGKTTETSVYTDGSAHITYVNDMLYWFDAKDDAGADCMFVKE